MKRIYQKYILANKKYLTYLLSFAALLVVLIRGIHFANTMNVTMDEGLYLLKGKYYLEGRYSVYEEGGPVTNKGPFSFWIFGLSQIISPGLRSGRYFSVCLLLLMLLVLWKLVKRFANEYWAAGILWLVAMSGYWVSLYSKAMTEVVTAALITLSLYFLLGGSRKTWEITLGLLLAAVAALTRQNLLPYFGFAVLYVFWQNGIKKEAVLSSSIAIGFFAVMNLLYWPDMYLSMWRPFLPSFLTAPVDRLTNISAAGDIGKTVLDREYSLVYELQVLFDAIRIYIAPVIAVLSFSAAGLWKQEKKEQTYKAIWYLYVSFVFLFVLHLWAAFSKNAFLYSFPAYPAFFLPIGLLLIPVSYSGLKKGVNTLQSLLFMSAIIILSTGIGLTFDERISTPLMNLPAPRIRSMRILPGTAELWRLLENKFHLGYANLAFILSAAFGFFVGVCIVIVGIVIWRWIIKKKTTLSLGRWFFAFTFGMGLLLTPFQFFSGHASTLICQESVLDRQEAIGQTLAEIIPPGSLIYWEYYSPTVLLYLEDIELFPIQLNGIFYKRSGGDKEALIKANLWNDDLAEEWMLAADFILLDKEAANRLEPVLFEKYYGLFDKLPITDNAVPCVDRSYLHIYRKIP